MLTLRFRLPFRRTRGWSARFVAPRTLLAVLLGAFALGGPAPAVAFTSFGPPFTGAADLVSGFPTCPNPGGGGQTTGPYGGTSDARNLFIADICNGTTYKLPLSGGDVSSSTLNRNGFDLDVLAFKGNYFGTGSSRATAKGPGPEGVYSFDPNTLVSSSRLAQTNGCVRQVAGDPLSTDVYLSGCSQITRVQNPTGGSPTVTSFGAAGNTDGIGWAPDGSVLYTADIGTGHVVGYNRTGTQVLNIDLSTHRPQGLAVAPNGTRVNGLDISGNVFVNDNDGTVMRINTSNANAVSTVATGGDFGVAAFFDSAGNLDIQQQDRYVRLFGNAPPVLGRAVDVGLVSGRVTIGVPGRRVRFVALRGVRQVPVGSFVNASRGTVRLTSAANTRGAVQSGDFTAGVLQVKQSRHGGGLTDLNLSGGSFRGCARGARRALAARSSRVVRRLRGNAHGRFRTRGRYSAATVRGTKWETIDRCDGTLTRVTRGVVTVRDLPKHRNVTVRAHHSYLARAG